MEARAVRLRLRSQAELESAIESLQPCTDWDQLIASVVDTAHARGQPWYASLTPAQGD